MVPSSQSPNMLKTSLPQHSRPPKNPTSLQCYISLSLPTRVTNLSCLPRTFPFLALKAPKPGNPLSSRPTGMIGHSFPRLLLTAPQQKIATLISKIISCASYLMIKITHDHLQKSLENMEKNKQNVPVLTMTCMHFLPIFFQYVWHVCIR